MKTALVSIVIGLIMGACSERKNVYFIISNQSMDKPTVDCKIAINEKMLFQQDIKMSMLAPDLQNIIDTTLANGEYTISVQIDKGRTSRQQKLKVTGKHWVFINYNFDQGLPMGLQDSVIDGATGKKVFMGYNPYIEIYITDKEPIHH